MTNPFGWKSWSPYLVGAGIGALSWIAFATVDKPLGITTAFEHTAAIGQKAVLPEIEERNAYYAEKQAEGNPPKIGWEWMLVLGVFFGSLISSHWSGDRAPETVPDLWASRFGSGKVKRLTVAFLSAALMIFGARLAQGCTSGHGISGTLQLAVSSWIFIAVAFGVASATTLILYGKQGMRHV